MRETFKKSNLDGTISITLDSTKGIWKGDKRSLVDSIVSICEQYQSAGDNLSLRQLYYQLVSKDLIPNHDKVYKKIGSIKDDIVYSGLVDWDVFEDRGRTPISAYKEESISGAFKRTRDFYKLDRQLNQPNHIEVWTEKDAISGILSKVTLPYSVKLVINKGYTSSTAVYEAYNRFLDAFEAGQKVVILYFGDHDPSGLDMIRDIRDRLEYMFINGEQLEDRMEEKIQEWWDSNRFTLYDVASIEGYERVKILIEQDDDKALELFLAGRRKMYLEENGYFSIVPIGLTMEQIKKYNPPHNPAKITDPRAQYYVRQFGQMSWEVDALTPDIMRSIVRDKIIENMNMDIYESVLLKERKDKEKIENIINKLKDE